MGALQITSRSSRSEALMTFSVPETSAADLAEKKVHCALDHFGQISARVAVPSKISRAFELLLQRRARVELDAIAAFRQGLHVGTNSVDSPWRTIVQDGVPREFDYVGF